VTKQAIYDLHTHSNASDGKLSPSELVSHAYQAGITHLALTDHDSVSGIQEAEKQSQQHGIKLISGIELSCRWLSYTIHIVGLNIDPENDSLLKHIQDLSELREDRAKRISRQLEKVGINDAYYYAKQLSGDGTITRQHFAMHIVKTGHAKTIQDVFKKYLTRNKPGYVAVDWPDIKQTINCIQQANGIAVIAHPLRYKMTNTKLKALVKEFKEKSGEGIEVASGNSNNDELNRATTLCKQFELFASTGSDFHNPDMPWTKLGKLAPIPEILTPVWANWHH